MSQKLAPVVIPVVLDSTGLDKGISDTKNKLQRGLSGAGNVSGGGGGGGSGGGHGGNGTSNGTLAALAASRAEGVAAKKVAKGMFFQDAITERFKAKAEPLYKDLMEMRAAHSAPGRPGWSTRMYQGQQMTERLKRMAATARRTSAVLGVLDTAETGIRQGWASTMSGAASLIPGGVAKFMTSPVGMAVGGVAAAKYMDSAGRQTRSDINSGAIYATDKMKQQSAVAAKYSTELNNPFGLAQQFGEQKVDGLFTRLWNRAASQEAGFFSTIWGGITDPFGGGAWKAYKDWSDYEIGRREDADLRQFQYNNEMAQAEHNKKFPMQRNLLSLPPNKRGVR